jgi:hypothetical protein
MNAAVQQQHILQAVNWSRFNLEEWLYQFGAWMNSVSGRVAVALIRLQWRWIKQW